MRNPSSVIWLVLIGVSMLITYLVVRRSHMRLLLPVVIGSVVDIVLFGLFSLSENNLPAQALVVALILGILFNALTVTAAAFFRQNTQMQP
ncbi:MAG: hypothetical protein ACYDBJ_07040 [Aggregatilineales bacterium]